MESSSVLFGLWLVVAAYISPHATFAVPLPVVIFCSMVSLAAFLRYCRVGHLSSTSIFLNLISTALLDHECFLVLPVGLDLE